MAAIRNLEFHTLTAEGEDFKNPRLHINQRALAELAESIEAQGLIYPLQVWRTNGQNIVVDGGRRLRAIGLLINGGSPEFKTVPCQIIDAENLHDARMIALIGNIQRVDLKSFEVAREMAELKEAGVTGKDIAERLGKSQAWVSRQLSAYTNATNAVKAAWKRDALPDDDVFHLAKLEAEEQNRRLHEILVHREDGTNVSKGKARELAKKPKKKEKKAEAPKAAKPSEESLRWLIERVEAGIAAVSTPTGYLRGIRDAALFALGELALGEFDDSWITNAGAESDRKEEPAPPEPPPPPKDDKEPPRRRSSAARSILNKVKGRKNGGVQIRRKRKGA